MGGRSVINVAGLPEQGRVAVVGSLLFAGFVLDGHELGLDLGWGEGACALQVGLATFVSCPEFDDVAGKLKLLLGNPLLQRAALQLEDVGGGGLDSFADLLLPLADLLCFVSAFVLSPEGEDFLVECDVLREPASESLGKDVLEVEGGLALCSLLGFFLLDLLLLLALLCLDLDFLGDSLATHI